MLLLEVAFVSGPKGRRFKSRQGQIGHTVANGSLPLRHFFERNCVQGWQYGTVRLNFCQEVRYAGTVRFFCNGTGTLCWYGTPFV